jgi:hypothetical protein
MDNGDPDFLNDEESLEKIKQALRDKMKVTNIEPIAYDSGVKNGLDPFDAELVSLIRDVSHSILSRSILSLSTCTTYVNILCVL